VTALASPWGRVRVRRDSPQLVGIDAENQRAAAFGQGWAAGRLRSWQLELQRRVASGTLAELLGEAGLPHDRFQRHLGLVELAEREARRDQGSEQAELVRAYAEGVQQGARPSLELLLLGHRPRPFEVLDVYLVAELKYFINSAWRFQLLHTLIAGALPPDRHAELFALPVLEGGTRPALPRAADGRFTAEVAAALAAGLEGLGHLGLSSPDIGSNAFAVSGAHTATGFPLLASDPHMGLVSPGFNLLMRVETGDGLRLFGSHFPGVPGIVVGRNQHLAWGMVGLMADNQDLLWGELDEQATRVAVAGQWVPLEIEQSMIQVRGGAAEPHVARRFAGGRLLHTAGNHGLFLRWPALDHPLGSIALAELARARDWASFRAALSLMHNAPMVAVYADRAGAIGLQAVGLIPQRAASPAGLVQSLDRPQSAWRGYLAFDALPSRRDPEDGILIVANQYEAGLFDLGPPLAVRWHPPTRAQRIRALLAARQRHDAASFAAIQDDRVDDFAGRAALRLTTLLGNDAGFAGWDGDTRDTRRAILFERWIDELAGAVLGARLPARLAAAWPDQWPAYRWNLLAILEQSAAAWGIDDRRALLARTLERAAAPAPAPRVAYRHTLRRHPLGRLLFAAGHDYDGGSRETVHALRRNTDFLTGRQADGRDATRPYSFGPAFKVVMDLSPAGEIHYAANTPSSGVALGVALAPALRRWRRGLRYRSSV
jgi:penicillin G amidase